MEPQRLEIIDDLRMLIAYHRALGIESYPHDAGILQFLARKATTPAEIETLVQAKSPPMVAHHTAGSAPDSVPATPSALASAVTETLIDISGDINACRNCQLHAQRVAPVPGRGTPRARLLIIGTWLTAPEQLSPPPETIFGLEEDQMLSRMLTAIHLAADDIFVTNSIKCGLPASSQPVAADIQRCLAYLRRQIAVIAPEVICTMGIIATRALLDLPQSLSQLRGRFHLYTALDGRQIPLMPTYHPSYLLQAEEMKRQTWEDLQLIEKKLAGQLL